MTDREVCRVVDLVWFSKHQVDLLSTSLKTNKPMAVWYGPSQWRFWKAVGHKFVEVPIREVAHNPPGWHCIGVLDATTHRITD
jgi:hypothetical protein